MAPSKRVSTRKAKDQPGPIKMELRTEQKGVIQAVGHTNGVVDEIVLDLEDGPTLRLSTNQNMDFDTAKVVHVEVRP